ncbi:down syndrome cell adhesion molecule-like protein Dscam2, partial [Trichonephila clavipes]
SSSSLFGSLTFHSRFCVYDEKYAVEEVSGAKKVWLPPGVTFVVQPLCGLRITISGLVCHMHVSELSVCVAFLPTTTLSEESPRFETKFRTQMVKKGDDVTLTCAVSGDPPLSITWTRDKQPLNLETEPRFQVTQTATGDSGMKSLLRVTSVGRVDSALYTCLASNMYGQDDTNIQLIVQEQPDAPREVQISETGSRLVRLSWEPPFSGNSLITKYILHIRENDGDRFNSCQVIYSQFGLAIHQNDHQARRRFVEWAPNEIAVVPDFHKRILFSDEAHFWLNGYVNKQNCRICSEANPQVYVETPLHPEKLTVWCALLAGGILLQKR